MIPVLTHRFCLTEFLPLLLPSPGFMNSCCFPSPWKLSSWFALKTQNKKVIACVNELDGSLHLSKKITFWPVMLFTCRKQAFNFFVCLRVFYFFWYINFFFFFLVGPLMSSLSVSQTLPHQLESNKHSIFSRLPFPFIPLAVVIKG